MRYGVVMTLLVIGLATNPASAQIDPGPNGLGVYFDQDATVVMAEIGAEEYVTGYLIVTNPTEAGSMMWWQCAVCMDNGYPLVMTVHGFNVLSGGMPFSPCAGFAVSDGPPIGGITILAEMDFLLQEAGIANITVVSLEESEELLGGMFYSTSPGYQDPVFPFHPSSGSESLPVARINGEPPVAEVDVTWGSVKALYRD